MNSALNNNEQVKKFGRVAVLMGGWAAERAVSLQSGQAVLNALLSKGVDAFGIDVTKETILQKLTSENIDRVFIALHGKGGEDGVIQSVLEVMGLPYTGSKVAASALAMDKLRTKLLLKGVGLSTPAFAVMNSINEAENIVKQIGLPLIVKPTLEGSSLGMSKVNSASELSAAFENAKDFAGEVLAEQWIVGDEYTVAILGDKALPAIRLKTPHDFYDYSAKYQSDDTEYICPCGLSASAEQALQALALQAFNEVGASGWGRVDFMFDEASKPWIIEINTVPGMTDHSLVPMAAKQNGMDFPELVLSILALTLTSGDSTVEKADHINGKVNV